MRIRNLLLGCCLLLAPALTACDSGLRAAKPAAAQAYKPTLDVKLAVSGREVTVTVATDMKISPEHYDGARQSGEGHIHMYLDNGEKIGVTTGTKTFAGLEPGLHTLKVSLHNNDHTPYDVTRTVDFTIN